MQTTQQPEGRKKWYPVWGAAVNGQRTFSCYTCGLPQKEHISSLYCPEWRLRQLDGDR